jgi:hypothetical protein
MPNWAYNSMTVTSTSESKQVAIHDLQDFLNFIKVTDADGTVRYDLTQAHPMPKALEGTRSPALDSPEPHPNWATMVENGEMTQERYDELAERQKSEYEAGQKALAETGYTDWYEWCNKNWGTKWPPRFEHDDPTLCADGDTPYIDAYYETAWSPADELILKVSERFPNLVFEVSVTEEANLYVGATRFHNGQVLGAYYSLDDPKLPKHFVKRYNELLERSGDDDMDWSEHFEKMGDLQQEVLDYCEREVALMRSMEIEVGS